MLDEALRRNFLVYIIATVFAFGVLFGQKKTPVVISGNYQHTPLKEVLADISENTGIRFSYLDKTVEDIKVSISFQNLPLEEALQRILNSSKIGFTIYSEKQIALFPQPAKPLPRPPETMSISGFVSDAANGERLIGVNVYIPEINVGASTNTDGYYSIPKIPPGEYTLICEYLGYQRFTEKISSQPGEKKVADFQISMALLPGTAVEVIADSLTPGNQLYQKPISNVQLSPREINAVPQVAESDLLRALQMLPGIVPESDLSAALYVRGGTPGQNHYLLDGAEIYNPEHVFGIFSTFNTEAIKHVAFSKGGFGANYGGRLSSVLDVTNLDGNREKIEGNGTISLLSAKATVQMPIWDIGAVSASFRRTYIDQLLGEAIDSLPLYYFYDGNLKAFFDIDDRNKITISGYAGRDVLDINLATNTDHETDNPRLENLLKYNWGNKSASLRWTRVFNPQLLANFWVTGTRYSSTFTLGDIFLFAQDDFAITDITLKGDFTYFFSQRWQTQFGFEQKNIKSEFRQRFPSGRTEIIQKPQQYTTYLQVNWQPTNRWDFQLGLRYNFFKNDENFQHWAPRFSAKLRLSETASFKAATGAYYQYFHRVPRTIIADVWTVANQFQKPSSATHYILGFQKSFAKKGQLELEFYIKNYDDIYTLNNNLSAIDQADYFDENGEPVYTSTANIFHSGEGLSRGVELIYRKDAGSINGWIGYTYADTRFKFPAINSGRSFAPRHDRRSSFKLVLNMDLRNTFRGIKSKKPQNDRSQWTIGTSLVYATGQAITVPNSGYLIGSSPNALTPDVAYFPTEINAFRLPDYARMDFSLIYKRQFDGWSMAPYLQIYNIGNRKNVWFIYYDLEDDVNTISPQNMLPLLPTIGINFSFK